MNGEVIKQFLVSLGFGVDDSSLKGFNKAIDNAYVRVGLIAGAVKASAAGIFYGISKISEGFEQMGYEYRIISPMLNKTLVLRNELLKAYRQAGIDITKAVKQSVMFNMSMAKTKFALEGIYKSVGMKFVPMLTKQMEIFRTQLVANMPKITKFLERMVAFVFKAFEGVVILGKRLWSMLSRVYMMFLDLDSATGGWSTKILGLLAAWKLLNLGFLATPLGMLITGILALVALYDDFMVWKEGGESLIDWGDSLYATLGILAGAIAAIPVVLAVCSAAMTAWGIATNVVGGIMTVFTGIMKVARTAMLLLNLAMYLNPITLLMAKFILAGAIIGGTAYLIYKKWDTLKRWFSDFFGWMSEKLGILFSNKTLGSKLSSLFGGGGGDINVNKMQTAPLGSGGSSAQSINQKTDIIVQGSSDPQATARVIATEQNRVNFDMARNMKGATR